MPEDLRLRVLTEGDTRGLEKTAVELDGLADTAEHAERSTKGLGDEVDKTSKKTEGLGRQSKRTGHDIVDLDRRIVELKASLKSLNDEYERSGKFDRKKFGSDSRELSGLQRVKKTLEGLGDETGRWSKLLDSVIDKIPGISGLGKLMGNPAAATVAGVAGAGTLIGVGAIAGGAVTAGVGAGVAGAGIAGAAMQSKAVQDEWSKTLTDIKLQYLDATTSYEQPAIAAIKRIGGAIHDDVDMKAIFGNAVKFVEPLADSTAKAIVSIGRGFESLTSKAMPAVVALANGIQDLGDATGVALEQIGDGSEGGAKALGDFLGVASDLIMLTGAWIGFFEDSYDAITDTADGMRELNPLFGLMADGVDKLSGKGPTVSQLSGPLDQTAMAARAATGGIQGLDEQMREAEKRTLAQLAAIDKLNQGFERMFGILMSVDEATIRYQQSIDDLTKEWDRHGKALDANTQAGRDNLQLIESVIQGIEAQRDAAIAAGDGTEESYNKANTAYLQQLQNLRAQLKALGANTDAVDALIRKFEELAKPLTKHITVIIDQVGNVSKEGVISGGDQRTRVGAAYASGTSSAPRGWALVGEDGPELVSFAGGERVHTAADTAAMLAGSGGLSPAGGGGQPIVIHLYADSQLLRTVLINGAQNRGQSVAQFLGV